MPEPLTIAVSVVGLLKGTYTITSKLISFTKGIQRAPEAIENVLAETKAVARILRQLQAYLDGACRVPQSHASLLTLEDIMATLTDCVCALSKLETILSKVRSSKNGALDRAKWVWHEDGVVKVTQRLQLHKLSLGLMFNIFSCQAQQDAQRNSLELPAIRGRLYASNPVLANRVQSTEYAVSTTSSVHEVDDNDTLRIVPAPKVVGPDAKLTMLEFNASQVDSFRGSGLFTSEIAASLVCKSSVMVDGQSVAHSHLSGVTMSEISNISVVELPISLLEIVNSHHYCSTVTDLVASPVSIESVPANSVSSPLGALLSFPLSIDLGSHFDTDFLGHSFSLSETADLSDVQDGIQQISDTPMSPVIATMTRDEPWRYGNPHLQPGGDTKVTSLTVINSETYPRKMTEGERWAKETHLHQLKHLAEANGGRLCERSLHYSTEIRRYNSAYNFISIATRLTRKQDKKELYASMLAGYENHIVQLVNEWEATSNGNSKDLVRVYLEYNKLFLYEISALPTRLLTTLESKGRHLYEETKHRNRQHSPSSSTTTFDDAPSAVLALVANIVTTPGYATQAAS